jgi:transcriptional regulator with XRE-family HTH domain
MPGVRRSQLAVEVARRNQEQRMRIGGEIRTMRERRGWTRTELARRAGIGRMVESRVERGLTRLDLDALQRIGVAMDRPLLVSFGRDVLERPADAGHLAMQEILLRIGRTTGYSGTFELPTRPSEPWRSVDVGLTAATAHRMILAECWNTIGDVGAAARSTNRKRSELEDLAVGRWGADAEVGVVWVVRASARNRSLLQRYPEVFAARFPGSSRDWVMALTTGTPPPTEPGLIWCDVGATRIFEWRRR